MRKKTTVQILAVAALVALAAWLGFQTGGTQPDAGPGARHGAGPPGSAADAVPRQEPRPTAPSGVTGASGLPASATPAQPPTGGELLHEWLTSSQEVPEIANAVLRGWPQLKPEDHAMAVKALIPFVTNDRYHGLRTLLLDPKTSIEAKELLFRDLILRPKNLHLPLFLAVLRQSPRHPCADEARNLLYVRLGEDYGTDWGKWQARINEELSP
jgi:hypothetical protein